MANRIYGLSGSGMDVDAMVKQMMAGKQKQYDNLYKQKTKLEWQKEDYYSMYKDISNFRNTVFSSKLQSSLAFRKVASNNTAVTATANADAANMSHTIEVSRLASGVQVTSSSTITTGTSKDTLANQFNMSAGNFSLQVTNGTASATINVDTSQSIYDVVSNINKAGLGVTATYDANLDKVFFATAKTGSNVGLDFTGSSAMGLDFITNKLKLIKSPVISSAVTSTTPVDATLHNLPSGFFSGNLVIKNGTESTTIALTGDDTLTSLANKINNAKGLNVTAGFGTDGKFTIKSTKGYVDLSGSDAQVLNLLTNDMKLPNGSNELKTIGLTGVTSSAAIAVPSATGALANQFSGLEGKVNLAINDGSSTKNVTIDFATDTIDTIIDKIKNSGANVTAGYDAFTRKFNIAATNGATVDLSGSDALAKSFLQNNLKLSNITSIGAAPVSSSDALFKDPAAVSLADQFGLVAGGVFNFKLTNGVNVNNISINTSTDTMNTLIDKINKAGVNATAVYNYTTRTFTIKTNDPTQVLDFTGSDSAALNFLNSKLKINNYNSITGTGATSYAPLFTSEADKGITGQFSGLSGGKFDLKLTNGASSATVTIDTATMSLNDVVNAINNATDSNGNSLHANASYNPATGKFTLGATSGSLDFTGSDPGAIAFFTNKLKVNPNVAQTGNDAQLKLDGADITENSNTFTVAGVSYTLNSLTEANKPASVVVTADVDKTVENVKKFVDEYNKMLKEINDKLNEKVYKDYMPLTDTEKSSLSDTVVKQMEEKARSGILSRDPALSSLVDQMRNNFTDKVIGLTGDYATASSLGIDTSMGTWKDGGILTVDENKLRKALNNDPDAAYKVFGTDGNLLTGNQKGVACRLYDSLKSAMDKIATTGGVSPSADYDTKSTLGKEIKDYKDRMYDMSLVMKDMEDRYYNQFNAMEVAISNMQKQSSWLTSMLGGGGSSK